MDDEKNFRAHVLELKKRNPSWQGADIATTIESYEVKPNLTRDALRRKVNRILKRKTVADRPGRGRKVTIVTEQFKKKVKKAIFLKKGQSQRNVVAKLKKKGIRGKLTSVNKAIKKLGLKPFKRRKSQKLTLANKTKRENAAKLLLQNYGKRRGTNWKWDKIINTDFSGIFTLEPFQNSKNDVVYAHSIDEIPAELREAPKEKYPKGIMFWGAISSFGLIPQNGPINFTEWLQDQREPGTRGRMYMTGERYAKFLRERVIPTVQEVVDDLSTVIWQDDQDTKQRTRVALDTVNEFFDERIEPGEFDAKFADVYPIENVWGILREKVRGKTFPTTQDLVECVNEEWVKITTKQCKHMISKIPIRLKKVIKNKGDQVYEH